MEWLSQNWLWFVIAFGLAWPLFASIRHRAASAGRLEAVDQEAWS